MLGGHHGEPVRFELPDGTDYGGTLFDAHMHLAESAPPHYPRTMSDAQTIVDHQQSHGFEASALYSPMLVSRTLKAGDDPFVAVRRYNAHLGEIQARFPDRIAAAGISYPFGGEQAARDVQEDVRAHGFKSVMVNPYLAGQWLDQAPEAEPFLSAMEELGIPLIVHPEEDWEQNAAEATGRKLTHNQGLVSWRTLATSTSLYGFVFDNVLARHPRLRVLFAHLAGDFFGLLGRANIVHDRLLPKNDPIVMQQRTVETQPPDAIDRLQNGQVYVDTAWASAAMIGEAVRILGGDRVLMGTDGSPHPLSTPYAIEQVDAFQANSDLVEKIKQGNASALFDWHPGSARGVV